MTLIRIFCSLVKGFKLFLTEMWTEFTIFWRVLWNGFQANLKNNNRLFHSYQPTLKLQKNKYSICQTFKNRNHLRVDVIWMGKKKKKGKHDRSDSFLFQSRSQSRSQSRRVSRYGCYFWGMYLVIYRVDTNESTWCVTSL